MITAEEFVRAYMEAYQQGDTLHDLATRFNTTHKSIMSKTGKFHMQGVKLPRLKSIRDIDILHLNQIVSDMSVMIDQPTTTTNPEAFNATCPQCNKPFYSKSGTAKLCVNCIKHRVNPSQHLQEDLQVLPQTKLVEIKQDQDTDDTTYSIKKPCRWCGKKTHRNSYCSGKCRQDHEHIVASRLEYLKSKPLDLPFKSKEEITASDKVKRRSNNIDDDLIDRDMPIIQLQHDSMQRLKRRAERIPYYTSPDAQETSKRAIEKVRQSNHKVEAGEWNNTIKP